MEKLKVVNVIGATGMVGRELVSQLLERPEVGKVRIFVRRKSGMEHPHLEEVVTGLGTPLNWEKKVTGDVLFSALGTTLKQAGSKEEQYRVDVTNNFTFAETAARNGVSTYVLVSAAGADAGSKIFYSRMKGELDERVQRLPFTSITILRPSILSGNREVRRPMEEWSVKMMTWVSQWFFRDYRPVPAETVALAMINAALLINAPGTTIVKPGELFTLAAVDKSTQNL